MKKAVFFSFLTFILAFVLVGCGNDDSALQNSQSILYQGNNNDNDLVGTWYYAGYLDMVIALKFNADGTGDVNDKPFRYTANVDTITLNISPDDTLIEILTYSLDQEKKVLNITAIENSSPASYSSFLLIAPYVKIMERY